MHPITYAQAAFLGLLQGATELFPVSSLGHSVIAPRLLGWDIHQQDDFFLTFLVATHLATAIVLFGFFWHDWMRILAGLGRSLRDRGLEPDDRDAKLGWLLVIGTIPAGVLGLAFEHPLRSLFASPIAAAIFLFGNGLMLLAAEHWRRSAPVRHDARFSDERLATELNTGKAVGIGVAQAIALLPGFSRSGAAMAGGLRAGLSNEDAARFSFLLATPLIGLAALYKLPDLLGSQGDGVRGPALVGALCAAATAYLSVRFLVRFFETNRLTPFAYYCLAAGAIFTVAIAVT
ncbi:undecaprenyl-diphosphate phosphatase [Solirubrobacter soli]|uniref:undecaprenyl-diphosphate phosphatase n=1 Tax=Solirubrobacter soli TaxID=363832 RepID=UPI000424BA3C|nr:undecaprenyl-diphosphate phosphatase [Solirubrobacter soli]